MEIIKYAYQEDFLQIGYFLAVAVTIIKFHSEYFKGKPAYFMVLVHDLIKLSFVSLTIMIGFSVLIEVHRNAEAIQELQVFEPTIIYDDRISKAIEEFRAVNPLRMDKAEADAAFTEIFTRIFGDYDERPMIGAIFNMGDYYVLCGDLKLWLSESPCKWGERG